MRLYLKNRPNTVHALLTIVLFAPITIAEPTPLLDDPAGDYIVQAGDIQQEAQTIDYVDLAELTLNEDTDAFEFTLRFHDSPWLIGYNNLDVYLDHGQQSYHIDLYADTPTGAALHKIDALTGGSSAVGPLDADFTMDGVVTVTVPRDYLRDTNGAPPAPGSTFDNLWAQAASWRAGIATGDRIGVWDRMPNEGIDGGTYEVQQGAQFTGAARLWSPSPARASNGAANTFVFPVMAENTGNAAATYELLVMAKPDTWDVRIPIGTFQLDPGEQYRFPVMATLPSAHRHGGIETVRLVLDEVGGPSRAILDLDVVFHTIAQPSGHHPMVYLHSRASESTTEAVVPGGSFLYMNTLAGADDPDDELVAVPGTAAGVGDMAYSWSIPLHPSLQMGLDFDMGQTGTLTLPLSADLPISDARLSADLVFQNTSKRVVLANMESADPFDLGPGVGEHTEILEWVPEVDLVPYQGLTSLTLNVRLESPRPVTFTTPEAPKILPGGSMHLPLIEYEDPIDPVFLEDISVELIAADKVERTVPPGQQVTYSLELRTEMSASDTYRIDVTGKNVEWSTAPAILEVTPGQSQRFVVAVMVPEDAGTGDEADLVVTASPTGVGDSAFIRVHTFVDADAPVPGSLEGDAAADGNGPMGRSTPSPSTLTVLLGILAVGLSARRHA